MSGLTYATLIASSEPPTPAKAAETPNAATLYVDRLTPDAAAASSLSRTARSERPKRESSRSQATTNSATPIVHVSAYSHSLFVKWRPRIVTWKPWPVCVGLPKSVMPVEPPVRPSNFFRIVGSDDGDPEGGEREVEPRQPQRRNADEHADRACDHGGDRDRPEVADAVLRHQDRRRVAADRHERPVPERDLPAVAGQDVEAEDRDEVGADGRELHGVEVRERERQHDQREHADPERDQLQPHTRLTAARPNSPAGRTIRTPRMTASATASRSSPPTQCT